MINNKCVKSPNETTLMRSLQSLTFIIVNLRIAYKQIAILYSTKNLSKFYQQNQMSINTL